MDEGTVILGTAGHIDHGKTTLVKALTGIDTDRLKEEKARGITIELGFAYLDLPSGKRIGIVDVPGHEKFVKNMVAGAMGMDLVVLVIAADEGVMPQTREHLEICQLLGVKEGLVVLTKTDMVDEEWLELVQDDVRTSMRGTFLQDAPVVAVSSITGKGLNGLVKLLDAKVAGIRPRASTGPYRLPVDRVFTMRGFGTVVTGTSISGQIQEGDEVRIYPKDAVARIRGIQVHGQERREAFAGMRTALNLQGVDREQVERGDVIATPGTLHPSYLLDLDFLYLSSAERPLRYRHPVRFHSGTAEVIGRILFQGHEIHPGEKGYVQIKLERPVAVLPGDRYVLRSYSPVRTIGGGRVLNPLPRKRKRTRPDLWEELKVLDQGGPRDIINYHLKHAGTRGLNALELSVRTGLYEGELHAELREAMEAGDVVRLDADKGLYIHADTYQGLEEKLLSSLEEFHEENPLAPGRSKEELKSKVLSTWGPPKLFQKLLDDLVRSGRVVQEKDLVRLARHEVSLGEEEGRIRRRIESIFLDSGLTPPSRARVLEELPGAPGVSQGIFDLMVREGTLVRLKEDLYFHRSVLERVKDLVEKFMHEHGEMGVNDFRELTGGLSRKYMIPLLEYLDSRKITIRVGDKRRLRS